MNIYDCFMYFDEDMLLDLRLNVLDKYVKKFIITEATYTHSGQEKKLNFDIKNFSKFKDKIEYIIVDQLPPNLLSLNDFDNENEKNKKKILNGYARDNFQREKLNEGLKDLDQNDLIFVSDLDEIPNLKSINFSKIFNKIIIFKQEMFYYKLNLRYKDFIWYGTKACKKKDFISPQWLRDIKSKKYSNLRLDLLFSKKKYSDVHFINNGGWHFTCIRTPENLRYKLLNFAHHQDFEQSGLKTDDLRNLIKKKKPMYDHAADKKNQNKWNTEKKLEQISLKKIPQYIEDNPDKFEKWLD